MNAFAQASLLTAGVFLFSAGWLVGLLVPTSNRPGWAVWPAFYGAVGAAWSAVLLAFVWLGGAA